MPVTPDAVAHLGLAGHEGVHAASIGLATARDQEILDAARIRRRRLPIP
jgi:predicted nuclease of predicted toxin-antitoxin system